MAEIYSDEAELYDIAFDWDVGDEADWLVERLGRGSVLEPGCGSGRMLVALVDRGLGVAGIDLSPAMVELARARLAGRGEVIVADMTAFDLDRRFDGAVCPINTLLHLTPADLQRHLDCMAGHASRYLVQVGLVDPEERQPFAARTGRQSVTRPGFESTGSTRSSTRRGESRVSARGSRCSPARVRARCSRRCTR